MAHSKIVGGSTAKRVINCPGSVKLCNEAPEKPSSSYADEGTLLHNTIAEYLGIGTKPVVGTQYEDAILTQDLLDEKYTVALELLNEVDPENVNNVIELTRLWVDDSVPKNGESYLIGNTLKHCGKEIVVSYADTEQNHLGIVYQATNWLYSGLSAKRTNWTIEGVDKHCQTIADKYTAKEIRELYGDRFSLQPRSRKHRYIYINADKRRKKELMAQLKYKLEEYPKNART